MAGRWVPKAIPQVTQSRKCILGEMIGPDERSTCLCGGRAEEGGLRETGAWEAPRAAQGSATLDSEPEEVVVQILTFNLGHSFLTFIHSSSLTERHSELDPNHSSERTGQGLQCCGICILGEGGK